ncbi:hypothetical protein KEM56_005028 [Ascosphaera pollenicola]|nr:hypothetical protein KEM56_005028 [Ascosphaera pollenicola]
MFSLRSFSRAVPRSLPKSIVAAPSRSMRYAKPAFTQPLWTNRALPVSRAAFSTSSSQWEKTGQVDAELAAKFEEELGFEVSPENSQAEVNEFITSYLKDSPFELKDIEGEDEVVMTRKFGNEDIKVVFSIADLKTLAEEPDLDESLADEDYDVDIENPKQNSASNPDGQNDSEDPTDRPSYPARVSVTIEKPNHKRKRRETLLPHNQCLVHV